MGEEPDELVDRAELARQTFEDPVLLSEVVGMFLAEAPVLLAALEGAAGAARAAVAHRLKGSALALGAHALAAAAEALEAQPDDGARLAAVRALCDRTGRRLQELAGG